MYTVYGYDGSDSRVELAHFASLDDATNYAMESVYEYDWHQATVVKNGKVVAVVG